MPRRIRVVRATLPRLWEFALEHLLLLPAGASIALVWVNAAPESYFGFTYAISFAVNDVAMVFFFALMTKEVVEATAPGGVLHPWRRAMLPVIAAIGATIVSALIHVRVVEALDEPALRVVWPVAFGTDIAVSYFVTRIIFRRHPVVPFVLLLAIASDALGFLAIAVFHPTRDLRLAEGALIMAVAIGLASALRRARVKNFWPYLLAAGQRLLVCALQGRPPSGARAGADHAVPASCGTRPGFFVDAPPEAQDTLSRFEIWWRYPAQAALFFFGLVNAGVPFHALEEGTWGLRSP